MATRATKAKATPAVDALTCPECGKTFTRAAALGAHRKMTHGVAGTSKNATGKRTNATASRKRRTTTSSRGRSTTAASNGGAQPVDRDALLRTLFPAGIPPRQDVIKRSTRGSTKQNASPAAANRPTSADRSSGYASLPVNCDPLCLARMPTYALLTPAARRRQVGHPRSSLPAGRVGGVWTTACNPPEGRRS